METIAYRNLTNGLWSLKQKVDGKPVVVGHCTSLTLYGVRPKVSAARHKAVRAANTREVFAVLIGDLCSVEGFVPFNGRDVVVDGGHCSTADMTRRVTFHPFEDAMRGFFWVDSGEAFVGCEGAHFTSSHEVYCA